MGLFGRLFGERVPRSTAVSAAVEDPRSVSDLPPAVFHGLNGRSPNGRYTVVWHAGGHGSDSQGRYTLLDGKKVVAHGLMQGPSDGKVSDNGTFIINEAGPMSELSGVFHAFRSDGSPVVARAFTANLLNNGLSADGSMACCQTCNSSTGDSALLTIFDLISGAEISRFAAESGWAIGYEFSPSQRTISLRYVEGAYVYALSGSFVDREVWKDDRLKRGDLLMVRRCMDEVGGRPDFALAERLLDGIEAALSHRDWRDHRWQAVGWRLRGEIYQAGESFAEALSSYDRALAFDPKIGIKRRADQLRKRLQGGDDDASP